MTPENFQAIYPLAEGSEEVKTQMLATLGISPEELSAAMRMGRTDIAESRNLLKLVRASREGNRSAQ